MLRTNIDLDAKLLDEGMKLTHLKTKKALVSYALKELVTKMRRKKLFELEGKAKWNGLAASAR
jgi:Arc/MetJ family transcription regulator